MTVEFYLHFELARREQPLEELPAAHDLHAIATAALVPVPEPEQGHDFLSGTATLGQPVPCRVLSLPRCGHNELSFRRDLWIHTPVLSPWRPLSRPIANGWLITPLTLLHGCPEHHQAGAEASDAEAGRPASVPVLPRVAEALDVQAPPVPE